MAEITQFSPYRFSFEVEDEDLNLYATDYEPYNYQNFSDNITHSCADGDTWHGLASKYWSTISNAGALYTFIVDFQPSPPVDPFIKLKKGQIVIIPSFITLTTRILNPSRQLLVI
jgi:hypothetical protein